MGLFDDILGTSSQTRSIFDGLVPPPRVDVAVPPPPTRVAPPPTTAAPKKKGGGFLSSLGGSFADLVAIATANRHADLNAALARIGDRNQARQELAAQQAEAEAARAAARQMANAEMEHERALTVLRHQQSKEAQLEADKRQAEQNELNRKLQAGLAEAGIEADDERHALDRLDRYTRIFAELPDVVPAEKAAVWLSEVRQGRALPAEAVTFMQAINAREMGENKALNKLNVFYNILQQEQQAYSQLVQAQGGIVQDLARHPPPTPEGVFARFFPGQSLQSVLADAGGFSPEAKIQMSEAFQERLRQGTLAAIVSIKPESDQARELASMSGAQLEHWLTQQAALTGKPGMVAEAVKRALPGEKYRERRRLVDQTLVRHGAVQGGLPAADFFMPDGAGLSGSMHEKPSVTDIMGRSPGL